MPTELPGSLYVLLKVVVKYMILLFIKVPSELMCLTASRNKPTADIRE